jgi:hypothetical protein
VLQAEKKKQGGQFDNTSVNITPINLGEGLGTKEEDDAMWGLDSVRKQFNETFEAKEESEKKRLKREFKERQALARLRALAQAEVGNLHSAPVIPIPEVTENRATGSGANIAVPTVSLFVAGKELLQDTSLKLSVGHR